MPSGVPSLDQFTGLQVSDIDSYDVVVLNYCAASTLRGTERSNLSDWLRKLDDWAALVKLEIRRHLYRFEQQLPSPPTPFNYGNSLGRFFCWYMLQVLQEDCGVKYHPDRKFAPNFCTPTDIFVHGILDDDGQGGTCASMPVVYTSVARRMGLPVYLVETRGHLFCRWDSPNGTTISWEHPELALWIPPDRFNVEGSGEGIAFYPDSHYMEWPERWNELDASHGRYLRSMNAKEELAAFLIARGECLWDAGERPEALKTYYYARQLVTEDERYNQLHANRTQQYDEWQTSIRKIEEDVRLAQRRRLPNTPGHSQNCECSECCYHRAAAIRHPPPPHGPSSCQCVDCRKAREAARAPLGIVGHPSSCQCGGCLTQRRVHPSARLPVGPSRYLQADNQQNHPFAGHLGFHDT